MAFAAIFIYSRPFIFMSPHHTVFRENVRSRYHTLFLIFCGLVVIGFYCRNNSSKDISNSLKIGDEYFLINYNSIIEEMYNILLSSQTKIFFDTWFSLADVSRKIAFISLAKAFPSSTETLRSLCKSLLFPTSTIGILKLIKRKNMKTFRWLSYKLTFT